MADSHILLILNQLKQCAKTPQESTITKIKKLHSQVIKKGLIHLHGVPNLLIKSYSNSHLLHEAFLVFAAMGKRRRDLVSWSTILTCFNHSSAPQFSLSIFPHMFSTDGLLPDPFILSTLLYSCSLLPSSSLPLGKQLHAISILSTSISDHVLQSSLLHMYSKCTHPSYASSVFHSLPTRSTASFTSLIHAFAAAGYACHAFHLFTLMPDKNSYSFAALISGLVRSMEYRRAVDFFRWTVGEMGFVSALVDSYVFSSVLAASSGLVSLGFGRMIHCVCVRLGFLGSMFVGNGLVDMYSKCSDVFGAMVVFQEMVYRDVVSWTSVIVGLSRHGEAVEAISMYECMVSKGFKPNEVTFVGLIYACSHGGLVEEGRGFFYCMARKYGIRPTLWHYTCYVDLLCRNGYMEEAEGVIRGMPFEPDDAVWACFLSACRRHGNTEAAARIEKLFLKSKEEENEECRSSFVLLSNIYAEAALWDKVARTRVFMTGMKKKHGCSSSSSSFSRIVDNLL